MKKLHFFQHYFSLLLATYKLFFKAARILAAFVFLLAPIQAIPSVFVVNAGQNFVASIIIWLIATALTQLLPPVATSVQSILTDKLTGFINVSLMTKSQDLPSLSIFDDSSYYGDLKMLKDDASWWPANLIVFGVAVIQSALTLLFMLFLLARYNWWIVVLLLLVMVPQSLSYYRIQQEPLKQWSPVVKMRESWIT